MDECCGKCKFWVNDSTEKPDDYTHENAAKVNMGFCIFEPLFTSMIASNKYCSDFVADGEEETP